MGALKYHAQKSFWNVAAMTMIVGLAGCGEAGEVQPVPPDTRASLEARIADDAVFPMTKADFSSTYAKLGADQFHKANELTRWAAVAALAQGKDCDTVSMVNVSDRSTRENIVWFVDCANRERVFIEQSQAIDAETRFASDGDESGQAS